ncbi:hypothetical protein BKA70DRAFT_1568520 [Coprinopsis sp. MPI-PUGE-AT-0042]|nr:hypothetical protein BKA70DRAFT_1568520 [Coprinopsis sp. MPI-PUGE-AT-0042]
MRFEYLYKAFKNVPGYNHDEFVRLWGTKEGSDMFKWAVKERRRMKEEQRQARPHPDWTESWRPLKDGRHYLSGAAFLGRKPMFLTLQPNQAGLASTSSHNATLHEGNTSGSSVDTAPSSPMPDSTLIFGEGHSQGLSSTESQSSVDSNSETYVEPVAPWPGSITLHVDHDSIMNHPNGPGILPGVGPDGVPLPLEPLVIPDEYFKVPDAVQDFYDYLTLSGRAYGLQKTLHRLPNGDLIVKLSDNYKVKQNDDTPEAITFCKITAQHPFRLGLKSIDVGLRPVGHLRAREQQLRNLVDDPRVAQLVREDQLDASWEETSAFLIKALEGARKGHGGRRETRSRVYIDPFVHAMCDLSGPGADRVIMYSESTLSEKKGATHLQYAEEGFVITGVADYIMFALDEKIGEEQRERYLDINGLDEALEEFQAVANPSVGFLVIEAKSLEAKSYQELKKHIPQVVMEAYVCAKKSKRKAVPWILTNGSRWLFGVLNLDEDTRGFNTFGYFAVKPLNLKKSMRTEDNKEAISTIWRMLTLWAFCNPQQLFAIFIRKEKLQRRVEKMALKRYPGGYFRMSYGLAKFHHKELLIHGVPLDFVEEAPENPEAGSGDVDFGEEDDEEDTDAVENASDEALGYADDEMDGSDDAMDVASD